jgi:hypothetical protein
MSETMETVVMMQPMSKLNIRYICLVPLDYTSLSLLQVRYAFVSFSLYGLYS